MRQGLLPMFAALSAAVTIAAGAFGAHAITGPATELLRTGGSYQLIHAVAALVVVPMRRSAAWLLVVGSALFAVSLYALALGVPGRWVGPVTPIGGMLMIGGWLWLAYRLAESGVRSGNGSALD